MSMKRHIETWKYLGGTLLACVLIIGFIFLLINLLGGFGVLVFLGLSMLTILYLAIYSETKDKPESKNDKLL